MHFAKERIAHTTAFDGPVVDQWLELKISQTANASTMQDRFFPRHAGGSKPLQLSVIPRELSLAPYRGNLIEICYCRILCCQSFGVPSQNNLVYFCTSSI